MSQYFYYTSFFFFLVVVDPSLILFYFILFCHMKDLTPHLLWKFCENLLFLSQLKFLFSDFPYMMYIYPTQTTFIDLFFPSLFSHPSVSSPFPSNIFSFPPLTILSLLQSFFITQKTVLLHHPTGKKKEIYYTQKKKKKKKEREREEEAHSRRRSLQQ